MLPTRGWARAPPGGASDASPSVPPARVQAGRDERDRTIPGCSAVCRRQIQSCIPAPKDPGRHARTRKQVKQENRKKEEKKRKKREWRMGVFRLQRRSTTSSDETSVIGARSPALIDLAPQDLQTKTVRTSSGSLYAGFNVTSIAPMLAQAHCSIAYALRNTMAEP